MSATETFLIAQEYLDKIHCDEILEFCLWFRGFHLVTTTNPKIIKRDSSKLLRNSRHCLPNHPLLCLMPPLNASGLCYVGLTADQPCICMRFPRLLMSHLSPRVFALLTKTLLLCSPRLREIQLRHGTKSIALKCLPRLIATASRY